MQGPVSKPLSIIGIVVAGLWCVFELGGDALRGDGAAALMLLFAVGFPTLAAAWVVKRGDPDAVALAVTFAGALAIAWIVAIGDERREDAIESCAR